MLSSWPKGTVSPATGTCGGGFEIRSPEARRRAARRPVMPRVPLRNAATLNRGAAPGDGVPDGGWEGVDHGLVEP